MQFIKNIFLFVFFVLALLHSPQRALASDVITLSFSNSLLPGSFLGAINDPALTNRLVNVTNSNYKANNGSSTISDLVGLATGNTAKVTWGTSLTLTNGLSANSNTILEGYSYTTSSGSGKTVSFSGLNTNSKYTLYVYSQSSTPGDKTNIKYSNGSNKTDQLAGTLTTNTATTGYVINQNYFEITAFSDATGYLAVNYSKLSGSGVLDAVQIKSGDPALAPVPEPSTAVLMGIGGIFAGIVWRKKQNQLTPFTNIE